jgi:hypothetical protein
MHFQVKINLKKIVTIMLNMLYIIRYFCHPMEQNSKNHSFKIQLGLAWRPGARIGPGL